MQKDDENSSDDEAPSGYERGFSPVNYDERNLRTLNMANLMDGMNELRQRSLKEENGLSASMTSTNLNYASGGLDYINLISVDNIPSTSSMPSTSRMPAPSSTTATKSMPSTSRMLSEINLSSTIIQFLSMPSASGMPATSGVLFTRGMPSTSGLPSASGQTSTSGQPSESDYEHDCSNWSTAASPCSSRGSSPMSSCRNTFEEYEEASNLPSASGQPCASDYEHNCSNWSTTASPCSSRGSSPMFSYRNTFEEYEEASSHLSASGQTSASGQPSASDYEHDFSYCSTATSPYSSTSSSPTSSCRNTFKEYEETGSSLEPFNVNKVPSAYESVREPPSTAEIFSYWALSIDPPVSSFAGGDSNYPVPPMPSPESYYRPSTSRNGCPLLYFPYRENPNSQLHSHDLRATSSTSLSGTLEQSEEIGEPASSVNKKETGGSDAIEKSKKSENQGKEGQTAKRETSDSDDKPSKKGKAGPGQKTKNRKKCNESQSQ